MNTLKRVLLIALAAALPFHALAADNPPAQTQKSAIGSSTTPVYKPPLRGAPAGRIGGGTRGTTDRESFSLLVLAPDHIGYTTQEQPCLYWYISKPTTYSIELTVTERNAVKPLVEKILKGPEMGGIQTVCLSQHDVMLQRDIPYKWYVTLVTDAAQRSKDILAGGIIEKIAAPETLSSRLLSVEGGRTPFIYAEEGLWYDALGAISKMIEASPEDVNLRQQRASLLRQVGLTEVADAEELK